MHRIVVIASLLCACSAGAEDPVIDHPAPVLERLPAMGSGPLEPGSYLVAFNVPAGDVLHDEIVRMDVAEEPSGGVSFAPPWGQLENYWVRDDFGGFDLEHDVAPGRCTSCYVVGWAPARARVHVALMGLDGIQLRGDQLFYDRSRAKAAVQEHRAGEWVERRVSVEILRDELAPELRVQRVAGPLLPWSTLTIETSEPLASEHLAVRVGRGDVETIYPGAPNSPDSWWPLGGSVELGVEGVVVDHEGNDAAPRTWSLDVIPRVPTRAIGGTGGLVHWGELAFDRGAHYRLAGQAGLGFFAMLELAAPARSVSASISICGDPRERVLCTSTWSFPDESPRTQALEMDVTRLPSEGSCYAPPQTISLGQSTGETIMGEIGVAATFTNPDGTAADDVHVVVHSIWADNDVARGGS